MGSRNGQSEYAGLLRPSREGDQFHYLWAARRLLQLLRPNSDLVAVAIEDFSKNEAEPERLITAGDVVIDLAEYDGDERLEKASAVRYIQLKHSTRRSQEPWDAAGLAATIQQFALRFSAIEEEYGWDVAGRLSFHFVTNRPISESVVQSVEDLAGGTGVRHSRTAKALDGHASLPKALSARFWRSVVLRGREGNRLAQQNGLQLDVADYLPGQDLNAPLQLKNLVVERLSPEFESDPVIRRSHVLGAVGTSPDDMFPAPNLIEFPLKVIAREQEAEIVQTIVDASFPLIVQAPSGVGKSMLTTRLGELMPAGSVTVVYDCFGSGGYRRPARPRHRPREALVQMVNELSELGLCDPLVPNSTADATAYYRSFLKRLEQAQHVVGFRSPDARLVLVVDAADNAEMAASEAGDEHSFAKALLREPMPPGVRLVMLCRPERFHLLNPPPNALAITLRPFTEQETGDHLRQRFPDATVSDVGEFHRRTSFNPRVQANAMAMGTDLASILRELGPNPKSVGDTIADQLKAAMAKVLDDWRTEKGKVAQLCAAMSILRPLIPIEVLAKTTGLATSAIESFAVDFFGGRAISVIGNSVQFRDEPVEDWFRQTFRRDITQVSEFIETLKPLAGVSPYVASALPAMLHEANRLDELIDMALGATHLPAENALQRREVELQRFQFALRASLRAGRKQEAAKLALLIGGEAAGDSRHVKLIQENWDLAGRILDVGAIEELVARRAFNGSWQGARHAYAAALLAQRVELLADARSELRIAQDWLQVWSSTPQEQRRSVGIAIDDIAAMAWATLRLNGVRACLSEIARWRPPEVRYSTLRSVVCRLIDAGEFGDIDRIQEELAANSGLNLGLAVVDELERIGRLPSIALTRALLRRLPRQKRLGEANPTYNQGRSVGLRSVANLLIAAAKHGVGRRDRLLSRLLGQLPDEPSRGWANPWSGDRAGILAAQMAREHLSGGQLEIAALADPETRKAYEKGHADYTGDARKFTSRVGPVIAVWRLWTRWRIDGPRAEENARQCLKVAMDASNNRDLREDELMLVQTEVADLWIKILALLPADACMVSDFLEWLDSRTLPSAALAEMARVAGKVSHLHALAYRLCKSALQFENVSTSEVGSKISANVGASRALLEMDPAEAALYLERSIEVASRIGDDAYDRWDAILQLGQKATTTRLDGPELAYRFGRCGEVLETYLDNHFSWPSSVDIMGRLSARGTFAQVSRWRDRAVGGFSEQLRSTLTPLIRDAEVDAREGGAFLGFDTEWDFADLFDLALKASGSPEERTRIVKSWLPTFKHSQIDEKSLERIKGIATDHGLDLPALAALTLGVSGDRYTSSTTSGFSQPNDEYNSWRSEDWDSHFGGRVVEDMVGMSASIATSNYSFRSSNSRTRYWPEACARVAPTKAGDFIEMVLSHPDVPLIEIDDFLSALPKAWVERNAVRQALRSGVSALLRRNHRHVWVNRYYQRVSVFRIAEACSEPVSWVLQILFEAFAADATPLDSGEAFQLASLLALSITQAQALEVLGFALELIEAVLEPSDGDGPWSSDLEPTGTVSDSLAGLLSGCLSSPVSAVRWQAAHVVRRLGALDNSNVLQSLKRQLGRELEVAFRDKRFQAYDQHARLWFVIGIARSALENPKAVAAFEGFLLQQVRSPEPHVLVRHYAQSALLALLAAGEIALTPAVEQEVRAVNSSPFSPIISDRYTTRREGSKGRDWKTRRFRFGYDMDQYWVEPLAVVFNVTQATIEDMAEALVCEEWGLSSEDGWFVDARREAKVLNSRSASRSDMPRVDDLNFYLSFHALMTVAGRLLASTPAHIDAEGVSRFGDWLEQHLLSRPDGRWLADRRDPVPSDVRDGWRGSDQDGWRWSVTADEIRQAFDPGAGEIVISGSWDNASSNGRQGTVIRSALVSRKTADALLAALQTVGRTREAYLPSADDEREIDDPDFELVGWTISPNQTKRFDEYDPWAGDVRYPPRQIAPKFIDALNLVPDEEKRRWNIASECLVRVETWGSGRDEEGNASDEGDRILISKTGLSEALAKLDRDLIVSVEVDHNVPYRMSYRRKDEVEYADPYFRVFLVKADGAIRTI
jgi:hypothetical protein